jgi:hypothetical protein
MTHRGSCHGGSVPKAAINVRCLEDVDLAALERMPVDGRSL